MLTYAQVSARRAAIREGRETLLNEMADDTPEGELTPGQMLAAEWLLEWQARAAHGYTYAHMVIGPALPFPSGMDDADAIFDHILAERPAPVVEFLGNGRRGRDFRSRTEGRMTQHEERIAAIRAYLRSARQNCLAWPNESALVQQNCNREIEAQMAALFREGFEGYDALRDEVQAAWKQMNEWRDARNREAISQGLDYKKPRSEGGKS